MAALTRREHEMHTVFVYGTLLEGEPNAYLLEDAEMIGDAETEPAFRMLDMGPYPAAATPGKTQILGELYRVDRETLARLDHLEGVPRLYTRERIELADGSQAWIYLINPAAIDRRTPEITSGDWRSYADSKSQ